MNRLKFSGFTLIEVMVALVIFAVLALAATQVLSESASGMVRLEQRFHASVIANNVRQQLMKSEVLPKLGRDQQEYEYAEHKWIVVWQVNEVPAKDWAEWMRRIDLDVRSADDESRSLYQLSFLVNGL